jgi:hypothetical protein
MSCSLAHSDAAYVLGALSPTERLEFERHLPGCETCRVSVAQLAGLPGLLGRVPLDAVEDPAEQPPLPETVLPALVAGVRREQRRRRLAYGLSAAAAVAVIGVGTMAYQSAHDHAQPPSAGATPTSLPTTAPARRMSVVQDEGVSADVALTTAGWGTRVDLACTYGREQGVSDYGATGARYLLVIHTRDGQTEQVASWRAIPGKTLHMEGATATPVTEIDDVELTTQTGDPILRLDL